jgi:hypothetical protein
MSLLLSLPSFPPVEILLLLGSFRCALYDIGWPVVDGGAKVRRWAAEK